jgi:uncharacterized protein (TIGR00251 family)
VHAEIRVRVQPRARAEGLAGIREGVLVVRVAAPPVDGRANVAVCKLIARALGVPPSRVSVLRGQTGRDKVVRIEGVEPAATRRALGFD